MQKALAEVDVVEDVKAPKPVEPPKPKISGKERRLGHGVCWGSAVLWPLVGDMLDMDFHEYPR